MFSVYSGCTLDVHVGEPARDLSLTCLSCVPDRLVCNRSGKALCTKKMTISFFPDSISIPQRRRRPYTSSERPWCGAVNTNTSRKRQVDALTFLITNSMFLDLCLASVHRPSSPTPSSLSTPYGPSHFGPPAGKHFLQDKIKSPTGRLPKDQMPTPRRAPSVPFPYISSYVA